MEKKKKKKTKGFAFVQLYQKLAKMIKIQVHFTIPRKSFRSICVVEERRYNLDLFDDDFVRFGTIFLFVF